MKPIILILFLSSGLFGQAVATMVGAPHVEDGSLYDSDATIYFSASAAYNKIEVAYSATVHCAGVPVATYIANGGLIQPPDNQTGYFNTSLNAVNIGGMTYNTTYHVCVQLSQDGGTTWDSTNEYDITTLAKQDHTVRPPKRFNTELPDMTGATTVTVASDCSNINTLINTAIDNQLTTPTYIDFSTAGSCSPPAGVYGTHQIEFSHYAPDLITFNDTEVTTGSPGLFEFSSGIVSAITDGDLLTYDTHYGGEGGINIGNSCPTYGGMADGGHFYAYKVDSTHIKLACEGIDGNPLSTFVTVNSAAHAVHGYQFIPWHSVTGTCLSTSGRQACTYWARNLKWIILESPNVKTTKFPPYGIRADPGYFDASLGSIIVNPLGNIGPGSGHSALVFGTEDGNDHTMVGNIMVRGLEFTNELDPSFGTYCQMFLAGAFTGPITFAQNYFHGPGTPQRWGTAGCPNYIFQGTNFSFRDNYVDGMLNWDTVLHEGATVTSSDGPGPIEFWNNHIEGVGVAIHFDNGNGYGSDGSLNRGDYYVARNYFYSPPQYMHGGPVSDGFFYGQRQPLEFKNGYRIRVRGNKFDYEWAEITPASVFVAATSVSGIGITDFDVSDNWFNHGPGITNFPSNTNGGSIQTIPPNRSRIYNNLGTDISAAWQITDGYSFTSKGWFIEGPLGGCCNTADHNTLVNNDGAEPIITLLSNTRSRDTFFTNNILYFRAAHEGIANSGTVGGNDPCNGLQAQAFADCTLPGNLFSGNFFGSQDATQSNINTWWPSGLNYVASNPADQTVLKYANASLQNYSLNYDSPYVSASAALSTDHRDVGVNMSELTDNMGTTKISSITAVTDTSARINYYNPDGMTCYVQVLTHAWPISGSDTPLQFTDSAPVHGNRYIDITGLTAETLYYPKLMCNTDQSSEVFKTSPSAIVDETEFVGPFNTWTNVKTSYGAAGNGTTDDTTSIQNGLNALQSGSINVLYFPAGTYKITSTLTLTGNRYHAIVGEDPTTTTIKWAGSGSGDMMRINGVAYSRIQRLTFDGSSTTGSNIWQAWDGTFTSGKDAGEGNVYTDMIFKDAGYALRAGLRSTGNYDDADTEIIRTKFYNCSVACVSIESFNALNWQIFDSEFFNANIGVTNAFYAGDYMVYNSVFHNSVVSDLGVSQIGLFSVRGCTSDHSKKFLTGASRAAGVDYTLQGNKIIAPTDSTFIDFQSMGPLIMLDNQFQAKVGATAPVVSHVAPAAGAQNVSVGDIWNIASPITVGGPSPRSWTLDDTTDLGLNLTVPTLPPFAPNNSRPIINVAAGVSTATVQSAINTAASANNGTVVHLQGNLTLTATLSVPANAFLQIWADTRATTLTCSGITSAITLNGPSKAVLGDFTISCSGNTGVTVNTADQTGGRVLIDQLLGSGPVQTLKTLNMDNTVTYMRMNQSYMNSTSSDVVVDGGTANTVVLGGTSSNANASAVDMYHIQNGGNLIAEDKWYEGASPKVLNWASNSGNASFNGMTLTPYEPPTTTGPSIVLNSVSGNLLFLNNVTQKDWTVTQSASMNLLMLGMNAYDVPWPTIGGSGGDTRLLESIGGVNAWAPITDIGTVTSTYIRNMLAQIRAYMPMAGLPATPTGSTDAQLWRIGVISTNPGVSVAH